MIRSSDKIQMLIDRGVMRSLYGLHKSDLPAEDEHPDEFGRESAARYQAFFKEALAMVELAQKILATS